jgi:hypothetical protein
MPPKTPSELKEQIQEANTPPPADPGKERTAEGLTVEKPSRDAFFSNLEKVANPDKK